jgi:diamine N-acetyltransferase
MSELRLAELSVDNLSAAVKLRVAEGQERFVAPVVESIAEAYVNPTAWPRVTGRFAQQVEREALARGVRRITVLWERGEAGPEPFCLKCGFVPTGEELFGEVVGARELPN